MPVGCSKYTPIKETHFGKILVAHAETAQCVINRNSWTERDYLYIDATAGSGLIQGRINGSPLIFLDYARSFYNWRAVFIEQQKSTYKELLRSIDQRYGQGDRRVHFHNGSYIDYIEQMVPSTSQIGLLYVDPNGLVDFEAVKMFASKMRRMEILLSIGATSIKRMNGSPLLEPGHRYSDFLTLKDYAHIRKPYDSNQWTFLMLSNDKIIKEYKSIYMRDVNSEEGAHYLRIVDNTKAELDAINQLTLL